MRTTLLLLCALLLPSSLRAATSVAIDSSILATPAGYEEVTGRRTIAGKVFSKITAPTQQIAAISAFPVHYPDSLAGWVEFDHAIINISSGIYTKRIRPSNRFGIDWNEDGAIRYLAYGANSGLLLGGIEFIPAFDQTNIDIEFVLSGAGIKANYVLLNGSAPDSLVWDWKAKATANWNGTLTKAKLAAWLDGKLLPPTALDANGAPVSIIRTKTAGSLEADSLYGTMTYFVQTGGAAYPIEVDPTVQDTTVAAGSGQLTKADAVYANMRDATTASATATTTMLLPHTFSGGTYYGYRGAMTFALDALLRASAVDSVRLYMWLKTNPPAATWDTTHTIAGTFTGALDVSWFNDFTGWASSGAYSVVKYTNGFATNSSSAEAQFYSELFTTAGKNAVLTAMGADSLRIITINAHAITDDTPADANWSVTWENDGAGQKSYLAIYYVGTFLGMSVTVQDSAQYLIPLFGVIDSTGGSAVTSRGFEYFIWGDNTDTTTVTETGTFATAPAEFSLVTDSLTAWTSTDSVVFRAWGTNGAGTSYSVWDTISVVSAAGGEATTDTVTIGRDANFGTGKF